MIYNGIKALFGVRLNFKSESIFQITPSALPLLAIPVETKL